MNAIVYLVHGTWPYGPPPVGWLLRHRLKIWTGETSALSAALKEALGSDTVIRAFPWSGRNSPLARRRASVELRSALAQSIRDNPASHHFIVGHSHGGNVILQALEDPTVR